MGIIQYTLIAYGLTAIIYLAVIGVIVLVNNVVSGGNNNGAN